VEEEEEKTWPEVRGGGGFLVAWLVGLTGQPCEDDKQSSRELNGATEKKKKIENATRFGACMCRCLRDAGNVEDDLLRSSCLMVGHLYLFSLWVRWKYVIIIFTVWKYDIGISLTGGCHHSH
jgi:hypothetical protein